MRGPDGHDGLLSTGKYSAPVRLCCGQRHWNVACPDGKVMCCLCFNRFDPTGLHLLSDGRREDVCAECAAAEESR